MEKVRVGLIGAGSMANRVHYPSLYQFQDVEMAGISDLIEEKMFSTAKKFGIPRTFQDYRRMLDEIKPDAVYILMPPHHLYDITVECLERGLHVFIEKPPGVTSFQTKSLARIARRNNCITMVGFQRRFAPLIRKAKDRVEERGSITQCVVRFVKNYIGGEPYYKGAVDILTCDAIHAVDLLYWIGGEVEALSSHIESFFSDFENAFNALLKFRNGGVGILLTNWAAGRRIFSVEIYGKGIHAWVNPEEKVLIYRDGKEEPEEISIKQEFGENAPLFQYAGFLQENRHFIDCIKEGKEPLTNFSEAVKTMELVEKIYRERI